jgi:hypothetical protein
MKTSTVLNCFCLCAVLGQLINAQETSPASQTKDSISPDKQWTYKCIEYGYGSCTPEIVKADTAQVVLDLDKELEVNGPESGEARIIWAPDSKRFGFNYSPPHAHHTTYKTVAFYQLQADKWVALRSPEDDLVKLAKELLPKKVHKSPDELIPDVVKVTKWTDATTAILFSAWQPWQYDRHSNELEAAFLLTLKFNANGEWKFVKKHRMSKDETESVDSKD